LNLEIQVKNLLTIIQNHIFSTVFIVLKQFDEIKFAFILLSLCFAKKINTHVPTI